MRLQNRGQSALEYLMTYGWAILVVIGVGVAMYEMGVLSGAGENIQPGKRGFSQVSPLDWSVVGTGGGAVNIVLTNEAGVRVEVSDVAVSIYTPGTVDCSTDFSGTPQKLRPGQQESVQLTPTECGGSGFEFPTGEYYRANVTITYTNLGSSLQHNSVGEIFGPVE